MTFYVIRRGWNKANQPSASANPRAKNTFESKLDALVAIVSAVDADDAVRQFTGSVYNGQTLYAVSNPRSVKGLTQAIRRAAFMGE